MQTCGEPGDAAADVNNHVATAASIDPVRVGASGAKADIGVDVGVGIAAAAARAAATSGSPAVQHTGTKRRRAAARSLAVVHSTVPAQMQRVQQQSGRQQRKSPAAKQQRKQPEPAAAAVLQQQQHEGQDAEAAVEQAAGSLAKRGRQQSGKQGRGGSRATRRCVQAGSRADIRGGRAAAAAVADVPITDPHAAAMLADAAGCQALVGKRISVYWPDDKVFHDGVVASHDAANGTHTVLYDDGDKELALDLHDEVWRLL
eukprot:GHRR01023223.1.p1 GENE.GHRR01023223.1~~GHRR01023223.1.p1  ORF type:complete len:275 (-),score=143.09 GHRR01023223.1:153-929(-)